MRNKRIIIVGYISIVLIGMLFIRNTYSMFVSEDADPNTNVYTTGNLDITYQLSSKNVKFTDSYPVSDDKASYLNPYTITVTNSGNVDYKFNVKLDDTTAVNPIDYKYIKVKIGKHEVITLDKVNNNVIYKNVVVKANSSVDVDVKIYISDKIPNSEVGKNFSAKLSINGIAVTYDAGDIDNSDLKVNYNPLSSALVGSYVKFNNNTCNNNNCVGNNPNYVDNDNMGYCYNTTNTYKSNGWRIAYIKNNIVYLISGGVVNCYNKIDTVSYKELSNYINNIAINYCNSNYSYSNVCDRTTIWGFNQEDYKNITSMDVNTCYNNNDVECGYGNDLINNGGYYWILNDGNNQFYWDPLNSRINNTAKYNYSFGIRVVMRLKEDLYIVKGLGTIDNPYIISNEEKNS